MSNFSIGDTVTITTDSPHNKEPDFYPLPGTKGTITDIAYSTVLLVKWESGSTSGNDEWYISKELLKPFE